MATLPQVWRFSLKTAVRSQRAPGRDDEHRLSYFSAEKGYDNRGVSKWDFIWQHGYSGVVRATE